MKDGLRGGDFIVNLTRVLLLKWDCPALFWPDFSDFRATAEAGKEGEEEEAHACNLAGEEEKNSSLFDLQAQKARR